MYLLEAKKLNKFYSEEGKRIHVLKDIDIHVRAGEFLMILGPSGSGKSTLLRLLASVEEPTSGHVVKRPNLKLGFVFQGFGLFPWLTVAENIGYGLKMHDMPKDEQVRIVEENILQMGLVEVRDKYPRELSGGQKQRVGIARALAVKPDVIFLDEPFSALDSFTANKLRNDLLDLWGKQKVTMVMVSHLIEEAALMADRIIMLAPAPLGIEANIENRLARPRNRRSKTFYDLTDKLENIIKV